MVGIYHPGGGGHLSGRRGRLIWPAERIRYTIIDVDVRGWSAESRENKEQCRPTTTSGPKSLHSGKSLGCNGNTTTAASRHKLWMLIIGESTTTTTTTTATDKYMMIFKPTHFNVVEGLKT